MLIEAELLPQGPQFASNIPRFGEEPEKLTKMLPEPDNTILMSALYQALWIQFQLHIHMYIATLP